MRAAGRVMGSRERRAVVGTTKKESPDVGGKRGRDCSDPATQSPTVKRKKERVGQGGGGGGAVPQHADLKAIYEGGRRSGSLIGKNHSASTLARGY